MTRFTHVRAVRARYRWVTTETVSGMLLLVAAALAVVWANSPWRDGFTALSGFAFGPEALHLNLNMSAWAADGLLAVFFFVVGVELKHEIVAGSLRNPREAAVPVLAAMGGMATPAIFVLILINPQAIWNRYGLVEHPTFMLRQYIC